MIASVNVFPNLLLSVFLALCIGRRCQMVRLRCFTRGCESVSIVCLYRRLQLILFFTNVGKVLTVLCENNVNLQSLIEQDIPIIQFKPVNCEMLNFLTLFPVYKCASRKINVILNFSLCKACVRLPKSCIKNKLCNKILS